MELDPDLTVCLPAGRDQGLLRDQLTGLEAAAAPAGLEAMVVAQQPDRALRVLLKAEFPQVILYELDHPTTPVRAMNHALRLARGRYLALGLERLVLPQGSLAKALDFLDDHPETGIVSLAVRQEKQANPEFAALLQNMPFVSRLLPATKPAPLDWPGLLVRAEVVEEIGLLDPRFKHFLGLADFCRRARRHGWHIAALPLARPAAIVGLSDTPELPLPDLIRFFAKKYLDRNRPCP